jgi:RHS repeat-associated protein
MSVHTVSDECAGSAATTTNYTYDYLNRMTAAGINNATTTFAYDQGGQRAQMIVGSTTYYYPSKFYSVASSTGAGAKYATTTSYIFVGDTLVAYINQLYQGGAASGTPQYYYVHPDHLGSTNVLTNASGTVVQTLDYYPYGSTRVNSGSDVSARKYIGQFYDPSDNLSYLNARYYDSNRGQFLSEDPMFWEVGQTDTGKSILSNPQLLNSYSYAANNPIVGKDADGRLVELVSRPVFDVKGTYVGAHAFFLVNPDHPSQVNIVGLEKNIPTFTLGGYPTGSGVNPITDKLTKSIGTFKGGNDNAYVFGNSPILSKVTITPPAGQTDTQFVNSLGQAYNDIDLNGMGYFGLGNKMTPGFYYGNSNNFAYTLGTRAGVSQQMNAFNPNAGAYFGAPGYGMLPTTSIYRQIMQTISNIQSLVSKLTVETKSK